MCSTNSHVMICHVISERIERICTKVADCVVCECYELMSNVTTFIELFTPKNNVKIETVGPSTGWFSISEAAEDVATEVEEDADFPEVLTNFSKSIY
jgi:hypothetical protein